MEVISCYSVLKELYFVEGECHEFFQIHGAIYTIVRYVPLKLDGSFTKAFGSTLLLIIIIVIIIIRLTQFIAS